MQEHLGQFGGKVEAAKVAWDNARYENAMKANPDKWKALKASSDTWSTSSPALKKGAINCTPSAVEANLRPFSGAD